MATPRKRSSEGYRTDYDITNGGGALFAGGFNADGLRDTAADVL